eukprot:TRINITY_DN17444_c0_g1_i1.p1 TRINITY_DN17444_c0_g1~~TRINITY_DN17444_c0_g1_i1.p1  ORF type:complete len:124 (-),score=25.74 TRINITY_DN17444_c0_g1_i1:248-592(-)
MSEYAHASKSALKLKGVDPSISKKKKKKNKDKDKERERDEALQALESVSSEDSKGKERKMTKAELAYKKRREDIEKDRIKKRAQLSHKDKVEKFNSYLNTLSEHYDIPKVSWTK